MSEMVRKVSKVVSESGVQKVVSRKVINFMIFSRFLAKRGSFWPEIA